MEVSRTAYFNAVNSLMTAKRNAAKESKEVTLTEGQTQDLEKVLSVVDMQTFGIHLDGQGRASIDKAAEDILIAQIKARWNATPGATKPVATPPPTQPSSAATGGAEAFPTPNLSAGVTSPTQTTPTSPTVTVPPITQPSATTPATQTPPKQDPLTLSVFPNASVATDAATIASTQFGGQPMKTVGREAAESQLNATGKQKLAELNQEIQNILKLDPSTLSNADQARLKNIKAQLGNIKTIRFTPALTFREDIAERTAIVEGQDLILSIKGLNTNSQLVKYGEYTLAPFGNKFNILNDVLSELNAKSINSPDNSAKPAGPASPTSAAPTPSVPADNNTTALTVLSDAQANARLTTTGQEKRAEFLDLLNHFYSQPEGLGADEIRAWDTFHLLTSQDYVTSLPNHAGVMRKGNQLLVSVEALNNIQTSPQQLFDEFLQQMLIRQ